MVHKALKTGILLGLVGILGYAFYGPLAGAWSQIYSNIFPCQKPITYSINSFDNRFKITKGDLIAALAKAETVWEKPINKDLFKLKEIPSNAVADLKINLIYDYRQEATEQIKSLGTKVGDTRAAYDSLKIRYAALQKKYKADKAAYEKRVAPYNARQAAYTKLVDYWNKQGGAPEKEYQALKAEEVSLRNELAAIRVLENNLNIQVANINAMVVEINRLAQILNINAAELNTIGQKRGEEFTEGEYKSSAGTREIDIYEFNTQDKLVKLIAHELGHALGLDHVEDKGAIMYYLNENKTGKLTEADLAALKTRCRI